MSNLEQKYSRRSILRRGASALGVLAGGLISRQLNSADAANIEPISAPYIGRDIEFVKSSDLIFKDKDTITFRQDAELTVTELDSRADTLGFLSFNSGRLAGKHLLASSIDSSLKTKLLSSLAPIQDILKTDSGSIDLSLFVYPHSTNIRLNASPMIDSRNKQHRVMIEATPGAPISVGELEVVTVNEAMHILYRTHLFKGSESNSEVYKWFQTFEADAVNEVLARSNRPGSLLTPESAKSILNGIEETRKILVASAEGALWKIFTESSYLGEGGHPWDSSEELFTSAATVMYCFPKSFCETVAHLPTKDMLKVVNYANFVVAKSGHELFNPELVNLVERVAQNNVNHS